MRPDRTDPTLLALLSRAQAGEETSMEALLAELYPSVRSHALQRVRDLQDADAMADDIAQEALLRIVHGIGTCRAESLDALFRWVLVITRHTAIDLLRRERACGGWLRVDLDLETVAQEAALSAWQSPSSAPAGSLLLLDLLDRVVQSLPPTMAKVLWLRVESEMTWPEIAPHLRTTTAAAKRRFQRAQQRLRKNLLALIQCLPSPEKQIAFRRLRQMGVTWPEAGEHDRPH